MTDAELTILSLVAEGARYGHEIQQVIDERGMRDWLTIGFSSIYYILNKLEHQNLLSSELRSDGRTPARKVYQLTDAGRGVLQTAILDILRQPPALGAGFELGLANLYVLKPRQVYNVLSDHMDDLEQRIQAVEASALHVNDESPDQVRALYSHGLAMMKAEMNWLQEFVADWAERYPAVKHPTDEVSVNEVVTPHNVETQIHRQLPPDDPAKIVQRMRRPKPPTEE